MNTFETINPFSGQSLSRHTYLDWETVQRSLEASHRAFLNWSQQPLSSRIEALLQFKNQLLQHKTEIAEMITVEMGKPIVESLAEIDKCVALIEYCTAQAPSVLKPEARDGYQKILAPQGVIYAIMPWNFPVWQTLRFCIPTLLAGNAVLVKPADNVAQTGALLGKIFDSVLALKYLYHNISIDHATSDRLIAEPRVRGVSFTGSTQAGRNIAAQCGKYLKKVVLELGGNDAYVIFADSDVARAAQRSFDARILNAGQSCISAKRFLVEESCEEEFIDQLKKHLEQAIWGDPMNPQTRIGPVSKKIFKAKLDEQVALCQKEGAEVVYQKTMPEGLVDASAFFSPTIVRGVRPQGVAFQQEIFGPVFLITTFKTEAEAIRLANHSPYGLGGAVFSEDAEKTLRVAMAMDTGSVALNDYFRSSPERPFGGVKDSGYGRELGPEGFLEFVNLKVLVKPK